MSEHPPSTRYDIIYQNRPWGEDENHRRAEMMAHSLLGAWRSRFTDDSKGGLAHDTPVTRAYPLDGGGQMELDSQSSASVRITHTAAGGVPLVYDFSAAGEGRSTLTITGLPEAEPAPSLLEAYDKFSRILFDCDSLERRG